MEKKATGRDYILRLEVYELPGAGVQASLLKVQVNFYCDREHNMNLWRKMVSHGGTQEQKDVK